ncbi:hypothetical protein ACIRD6_22020 [Streptomyces sp. NPDC102473]|uniref:hypothetical protein n=1 Tax=Streptomyces sp. NPDC102473 TaxID=3366180 RepID=UPI00381269FE
MSTARTHSAAAAMYRPSVRRTSRCPGTRREGGPSFEAVFPDSTELSTGARAFHEACRDKAVRAAAATLAATAEQRQAAGLPG